MFADVKQTKEEVMKKLVKPLKGDTDTDTKALKQMLEVLLKQMKKGEFLYLEK